MIKVKENIYGFARRKKERSFLKTYVNKFLNIFMKKGLKTKTLKFYFNLFRLYKQKYIMPNVELLLKKNNAKSKEKAFKRACKKKFRVYVSLDNINKKYENIKKRVIHIIYFLEKRYPRYMRQFLSKKDKVNIKDLLYKFILVENNEKYRKIYRLICKKYNDYKKLNKQYIVQLKFKKKFKIKELSFLSLYMILQGAFKNFSIKLELCLRKFKKREKIYPILVAPWKGFRVGLNMLLKNLKSKGQYIKRHRKVDYLHKILGEFIDVYTGSSITCKNINEFYDEVQEHQINLKRGPKVFVSEKRESIVPTKIYKNIELKKEFQDKKELFLKISEYEEIREKNLIKEEVVDAAFVTSMYKKISVDHTPVGNFYRIKKRIFKNKSFREMSNKRSYIKKVIRKINLSIDLRFSLGYFKNLISIFKTVHFNKIINSKFYVKNRIERTKKIININKINKIKKLILLKKIQRYNYNKMVKANYNILLREKYIDKCLMKQINCFFKISNSIPFCFFTIFKKYCKKTIEITRLIKFIKNFKKKIMMYIIRKNLLNKTIFKNILLKYKLFKKKNNKYCKKICK